MKKIIILTCFLLFSCNEMIEEFSCPSPTYFERNKAKSLYNDVSSFRTPLSNEEAHKIFGCQYRRGDYVYSYSRLYDTVYVLVRDKDVITYREVE